MAVDDHTPTQTAEIGEVPRHWHVAPLSAFVSRVTYGFTNPMPTTDEGPFMVTAKDVQDGRIDYSTARHTSWDAYRKDVTDKSRPRVGDVLLTKDGSIGRVAVCDRPDVCINQSVAVIQPNTGTDSRFFKYLLETPHYQSRMEGDSDGTTIKHIYITRVDKMEVAVPPLSEQRAIAHILGTLDDKIELNRRMNETLEAMARALFKSWFVDFDPVRAKAEGRDPGLPPAVAALFPDTFEDSELGEVPAGWRVSSIGDLAEFAYGKALKEEDRTPGPVPVFGSNGQIGWHDEKLADGPGIVVGRKGNPGIVTWVPTDFFPIDTTFYVVPKGECRSLPFLFYALKTHDLASLGADSAVPGLNRNMAYMSKQVVPSALILDAFDSLVQPLYQRIHSADDESRTLVALRDALLPKLISGAIRVKDTERFTSGMRVT